MHYQIILDQYTCQFNYGSTPGRKRKKSVQVRWVHLTEKCETYHNLDSSSQCASLINYLSDCSKYESEPTEALEKDPCSEF